jgi:uncharacterized LabA/DUF88 family protein
LAADQYAILLDGGFIVAKLRKKLRRFPTANDIMDVCERLKQDELLRDLKLLRIYFYNAPPCEESIVHPITKAKIKLGDNAAAHNSLHDSLELKPDIAIRMGVTVCHGFKLGRRAPKEHDGKRPLGADDLVPHIEQKGVDLRIGLDIARLALNRLVSTIVVVSGDSDFVPAFKFARREGLRVFLDVMGHGVRREMKVHADRIINAACKVDSAQIANVSEDGEGPRSVKTGLAAARPAQVDSVTSSATHVPGASPRQA